jgi:hypothetical protein
MIFKYFKFLFGGIACLCTWSSTAQMNVSIPAHNPTLELDTLEYFFDTDPGFGQANKIMLNGGSNISSALDLNIQNLNPGVHQLFVRVYDKNRKWSQTERSVLLVEDPNVKPLGHSKKEIIGYDYFIGNDLGYNGIVGALNSQDTLLPNQTLGINISQLSSGVYTLGTRVLDEAGNWSQVGAQTFAILNNSFDLPIPPQAKGFSQLEYFINIDPGLGNNLVFPVDIPQLPEGLHTLFVRITHEKFSLTQAKQFNLGMITPIFWTDYQVKYISNGETIIKWSVSKDEEISDYAIEQSDDGIAFNAVAVIASKKQNESTYQNNLKINSEKSTIYFRIKAQSNNGEIYYSPVAPIVVQNNDHTITVSNPSNDLLHIFQGNKPIKMLSYQIYSSSGKKVLEGTFTEKTQQTINTSQLPPENYFLRIKTKHAYTLIPFIKV